MSIKSVPYVFYSYHVYDKENHEEPIPHFSHLSLFKKAYKQPILYRKNEHDTQLVSLKNIKINDKQVVHFCITRQVTERKVSLYNDHKDDFEEQLETTSDFLKSIVIVIPHLYRMAISDKSGEHNIDANSTINRIDKILQEITHHSLSWEFASSEAEIRKALKVWNIEEVNFKARPFNPHPSTPGLILSDLMKDNGAQLRGVIKGSAQSEFIKNPNKGMISEIIGLAEKGYAQYGAKGLTDKGFKAKIDKKTYGEGSNQQRKLRVYVPERAEMKDHLEDVVQIMFQLYE